MNLIFDALNAQLDAGDRRMDAAGIPKIVRQTCPQCGGSGYVPYTGLSRLRAHEFCLLCRRKGFVNVEQS